MGVYIKDMKIPRQCIFCEIWSLCWNIKPYYAGRREDCPLIEVKAPHGRLIDADVCKQRVYDGSRTPYTTCPTVIEAEGK